MKCLVLPILLAVLLAVPASAEEPAAPASGEKSGPMGWLRKIPFPKFGGKKTPEVVWTNLRLDMVLDPAAVKLPDTRRVAVTLQLTNRGRKLVQLEFPSSQRVEVLLKDDTGRIMERWSDDQPLVNEPTTVTINPGERLEYAAAVSTREMVAGRSYTVEGLFPRNGTLRVNKILVPQ